MGARQSCHKGKLDIRLSPRTKDGAYRATIQVKEFSFGMVAGIDLRA